MAKKITTKKETTRVAKKTKEVKEKLPEKEEKESRYFEAVGRRKTAVARVRLLLQGEKIFLVNQKPMEKYFPSFDLQEIIRSPLQKMNVADFQVSAQVRGGGFHAQAEAVSHGISQALVLSNQEFRKRLRKAGLLTRDPRMRERKKFGLKRARKAPQWSKR